MQTRIKKITKILLSTALASGGILLIVDSAGVTDATRNSVTVCLNVIIPSLFSFMVFSSILIDSGCADLIFKPFYFICRPWFKGDLRLFSVFMLSLIGGYPVGVKLLSSVSAYNKNYNAIMHKILPYCYCGSPSFIIAIVGLQLYGNAKAGLIVYISNVLACLSVAIISNILSKRLVYSSASDYERGRFSLMPCIIDSIKSAVYSLSMICGTILLFNIILELLEFCGVFCCLSDNTNAIVRSFAEITNLSRLDKNNYSLLPMIAAVCSTGGACILMQTAVMAQGKIKLKPFLLARIPIAVLSGVYCFLLQKAFLNDMSAWISPGGYNFIYSEANPICSICLIFMSYILLKSTRKNSRLL